MIMSQCLTSDKSHISSPLSHEADIVWLIQELPDGEVLETEVIENVSAVNEHEQFFDVVEI